MRLDEASQLVLIFKDMKIKSCKPNLFSLNKNYFQLLGLNLAVKDNHS